MTSSRWVLSLVLAGSVLAAGVAAGQAPVSRIRVAVYPFDDSSVKPIVRQLTQMDSVYGQVAADYASSYLQGHRIEVITREQIKVLLEEQNRKYSDRFDPAQAGEIGRLLSVDAIVTGKIASINLTTGERPDGKLGAMLGRYVREVKAFADVSMQMIATETGSTLAGPMQRSDRTSRVASILRTTDPKTQRVTEQVVSNSQANNDFYLREALREAIEGGAISVMAATDRVTINRAAVPPAPPGLKGQPSHGAGPASATADAKYVPLDDEVGPVMQVTPDMLTFARTEGAEVHVGDVLEIHRPEILTDPRTRKAFQVSTKVATVQVTEVRAQYCRGKASGEVKADDRVVAVKAVVPARTAVRRSLPSR
jgi:hypothetical protein